MPDFNIDHAKRNADLLRKLANAFPIDLRNDAARLCRDAADYIDLLVEEIERLTARRS